MKRLLLGIGVLCVGASSARADWVRLNNGRTFAGDIVETGDELWIHRADGTSVLLVASEVAQRRSAEELGGEFDAMRAALAARALSSADRVAELGTLADWCIEYGLMEDAVTVAREILSLDAGHTRARNVVDRFAAPAPAPEETVRVSNLESLASLLEMPAPQISPSWERADQEFGGVPAGEELHASGGPRSSGTGVGPSTVVDMRVSNAQLLGFVPFNTPLAVSRGQTLTVTIQWPNIQLVAYRGTVGAPSN